MFTYLPGHDMMMDRHCAAPFPPKQRGFRQSMFASRFTIGRSDKAGYRGGCPRLLISLRRNRVVVSFSFNPSRCTVTQLSSRRVQATLATGDNVSFATQQNVRTGKMNRWMCRGCLPLESLAFTSVEENSAVVRTFALVFSGGFE